MAKKFNWVSGYGLAAIIFVILVFYLRQQRSAAWAKKEGFSEWPGSDVRAEPPLYAVKEKFVSKKCPDGTRTDGPCLMEFPGF